MLALPPEFREARWEQVVGDILGLVALCGLLLLFTLALDECKHRGGPPRLLEAIAERAP